MASSPCLSSSHSYVCDHLTLVSCSCTTYKRKRQKHQETKNKKININNVSSSFLDLSSCSDETNVCLHLSLSFCNCIEIAKKQETHVSTKDNSCNDVALVAGTSSGSTISSGDPWKIKKVLTESDLGNNSRLLLNRELAKKWVVPLLDKTKAEKEGVKVQVFDVDTRKLSSLNFKIWSSKDSHVFNETWIKDFVIRRKLKKGDEIGLKWDQQMKRFDFSVLNR